MKLNVSVARGNSELDRANELIAQLEERIKDLEAGLDFYAKEWQYHSGLLRSKTLEDTAIFKDQGAVARHVLQAGK